MLSADVELALATAFACAACGSRKCQRFRDGTLREQPRDVLGADRAAVARDREQKHGGSGAIRAAPVRGAPRPGRQSSRSFSSRRRLRLRPPVAAARIQWHSTAPQRSRAERTLPVTLAKVEKKPASERGDAARVPARDAPDPAVRGEGRGAVPRGRPARIPARRDRPGGGRGRRLQRDGEGRHLRVDAPRPRAHARARHASERGDGRALRKGRRLLSRLRRLDAPLRHRARQLGANAVIGGGLPAVTGAGLAFKLRDEPRVAVAFFGDGATNIGTFHESLNLAQLWKTKTVFVCENNHWAESTPGWQHSPVWDDMSKRALAYDMRSIKVDGQDVEAVHEAAQDALEYARSGEGPVFLDVATYRMHGHYIGDPQVYRTKEDREDGSRPRPDRTAPRAARSLRRRVRGVRRRSAADRRRGARVRAERHRSEAGRRAQERLCLS